MSPARKRSPTPSLAGVFDRLLVDIVSGRYPTGTHLPAERDLARTLGASRPTLREALRRLGEWQMVAPRRGSGVTVRDKREWALDVLPAYLRHGAGASLVGILSDLLAVRRSFFVDVLRIVAPRIRYGGLAEARRAADRAWAARADVGTFVREDFGVLRAIVAAADFLPALWLLNSFAGVYEDLATSLVGGALAPDDYPATYEQVFAALEHHDADLAGRVMGAYLDAHDRRLLTALGVFP
jgi:DNA-binding FadR family transcriptional regulator